MIALHSFTQSLNAAWQEPGLTEALNRIPVGDLVAFTARHDLLWKLYLTINEQPSKLVGAHDMLHRCFNHMQVYQIEHCLRDMNDDKLSKRVTAERMLDFSLKGIDKQLFWLFFTEVDSPLLKVPELAGFVEQVNTAHELLRKEQAPEVGR